MIQFLLLPYLGRQFPDTYCSISASGNYIAICAYDGVVKLLSKESRQEVQTIRLKGGARLVKWIRGGERLLVAGQSEVGLFSQAAKALKTLPVDAMAGLSAIATNRAEDKIALGFNTGIIELWDLKSGITRKARVGSGRVGSGCKCVEFSHDDKSLICGHLDRVTVLNVAHLMPSADLKCSFHEFAYTWSISPAGRSKYLVSLSNGQIDLLSRSSSKTWTVRALTKLNGECPRLIPVSDKSVDLVTRQDGRTNGGENEFVEMTDNGKQLGQVSLGGCSNAITRSGNDVFILLEDGRILNFAFDGSRWAMKDFSALLRVGPPAPLSKERIQQQFVDTAANKSEQGDRGSL